MCPPPRPRSMAEILWMCVLDIARRDPLAFTPQQDRDDWLDWVGADA